MKRLDLEFIDAVWDLFACRGAESHAGESVSQLDHAPQTAHLAVRSGAADVLVSAALLHDVGHLLHDGPDDAAAAAAGHDIRHEDLGPTWLAAHLPEPVIEPIRLHVDAKRYLCSTQPGYVERLSPASQRRLAVQGGPMDEDEVLLFERRCWWREALRLRMWDDEAKVPGLVVPPLHTYLPALRRSIARCEGALNGTFW
jgi:[1-hydroxy-2-(trimethylamino)ethyl]phosphonate dioxygenase